MKTSASAPSFTKAAACPSRTMSLAPYLISLSARGKRQTMVSRESSSHWMMSMSSFLSLSKMPMMDLLCERHDNAPGGEWRYKPGQILQGQDYFFGDLLGRDGQVSPMNYITFTQNRLFRAVIVFSRIRSSASHTRCT